MNQQGDAMTTMTDPGTIAPEQLAARAAAGDRLTILDVRDDVSWKIEGPGIDNRHVSTQALRDDLDATARTLQGEVVVVCQRGVTAQSAAAALREAGVDARALEGGMRGWIATLTAHAVEIGVPGVEVRQVQRPARGCLSYVVAAGGAALVVDPAPDADYYAELAAQLGARVTDVVDTHLHADHLSGARALAGLTGATLRLPAGAVERGVAYDVAPLRDGDRLDVGGTPIDVLALPGHTTDMTGLLVAGRALIGGDSLFADGIARPDLERGDSHGAHAMGEVLHATLHERVLTLGDDVVLLAGHDHPGIRTRAVAPRLGEVRARVRELAIPEAREFAAALLDGIPPRPANYEAVIAVNSGARPFDPDLETGGNSCASR
jgi:glyoxylase-like metal-dependent hydrolase (beta-lactamase superfamily II)